MPLLPGKANVGANIKELTEHGSRPRSHAQIVAIALSNADKHPRAKGGVAEHAVRLAHVAARKKMASGGEMLPEIPYFERQEARNLSAGDQVHPGGLVASAGPGRTDTHNVNVAAGSYVLPADIISGLGEGNTLNGASVVDKMLNSGPWGTKLAPLRGRAGGYGALPHPPPAFHDEAPSMVRFNEGAHFARGGGEEKPIPIIIAGGEYVLLPKDVLKIGAGDLRRGHAILDKFVLHVRKKTVKTLRKLPGPVK